MVCPKCGHEKTRVYGTDSGLKTVRFRKCLACGHTFKTMEQVWVDSDDLEYIRYMEEIGEYRPTPRTPSLFDEGG